MGYLVLGAKGDVAVEYRKIDSLEEALKYAEEVAKKGLLLVVVGKEDAEAPNGFSIVFTIPGEEVRTEDLRR